MCFSHKKENNDLVIYNRLLRGFVAERNARQGLNFAFLEIAWERVFDPTFIIITIW
jgi:hypothetical protein